MIPRKIRKTKRRVRNRTRRLCLPSGKQPDAFGHQAQPEGDDEHHEQPADGQEHKGKLPPILSSSLLFIESTIPDTLFFLPAFPFSDYCLKRGKAQFVEYQPEES